MTICPRALASSVLLLALAAAASPAQQASPSPAPPKTISDNSFLVEEAYNQEAGVVQHIANFRRARDGAWAFTFTQEWPAPGQRHQLSYTVPLLGGDGTGSGAGDVSINYRYQAIGRDEERVWFAPRLSALLPSGGTERGAGGPGLQVNLPLSVDLSGAVVTHWNAGATVTRARTAGGARATTHGVNAAASAIWLLAPTLNLMLESVWERNEALEDDGTRRTEDRWTLLPGVRGAINFASGMQVVPGIGVPIGLQRGGGRDLFLYLSVEHAFR